MANDVRVEVADISGARSRQIGPGSRLTDALANRRDDIDAALKEMADILRGSVEEPSGGDWGVSSIEATFAMTLSSEAGVLISKLSAEASIEVKITIEKN